MADIRINALATTAASTASDDFIAVDGSANGTRKLNAYSPTFGGNLTVSGTGTSSIGGEPSTGLATYSGNLRIQSTGNGPATVNGIELQNSQSGSGYGYKIYTNNSNDYIGIAGRFGSATWTEFLAIKQNTGNVGIGTTNPNAKAAINGTADTGPTTNSNGILKVGDQTQTNGLIVGLYNSGTYGVYLQASDIRSGGGTPNYPIIVNPNGGNLLIGTTTDGGQKLQVSGDAAFSGQATVTGANGVVVNKSGGGLSIITVGDGTSGGYCRLNMLNGPSKYGWSIATQDITDNALTITPSTAVGGATFTTPILTLEQSGNATFAGAVSANGNTIVSGNGNNSAQLRVDGVSSGYSIMTWAWDASYKWHAGMTTGGNNWSIGKVTAVSTWTPYLTLDHSTGNATFSGAIAIGNTVNTVSPTSPNRTITMVIGGTTYYIHAKTTND